jgi:GT2 family glycosyltransferase
LTAFDAALRRLPTAMIGGHVRNGLPENVFSSSSQLIVDMVYGYYNRDPDDAHFFATNNMVLPAAGFRELGGFDEHFGFASEDRDFCARWRERGYAMVYEPTAVIEHMHALSLESFCRQHFAYGRGAVEFHGRAARRGAGHFREHLGFHRSLPSRVRRVLKGKGLGQAMVIVSPLLLWQVANATGFFWERLAARRPR